MVDAFGIAALDDGRLVELEPGTMRRKNEKDIRRELEAVGLTREYKRLEIPALDPYALGNIGDCLIGLGQQLKAIHSQRETEPRMRAWQAWLAISEAQAKMNTFAIYGKRGKQRKQ